MKTNNLFLLLFILAAPDRIPGQGRGKPPTKALHRDDPAASGRKLPAAARGEGSISISAKAPPECGLPTYAKRDSCNKKKRKTVLS